MKTYGKKLRFGDIMFNSLNYLIFGIFALLCFYPFYYILIYSLSSTQAASSGVYFFPKQITLYNYANLLRNPGILNAAFISLSRTVIGTAGSVFCTTIFAYFVTKKELPARKFIYRFVVMTMYINAGLIPSYILMKFLGMINTFWIYIIPGLVGAFNLILIKTYIEQLPASLEESAMIDGAGYFRIFIRMIFPLSMPIIATVTVFVAVGQWNTFTDNLIYVSNEKLRTLQLMLYVVLNRTTEAMQNVRTDQVSRNIFLVQPTPTTIRMTITMIATLPIIFVYPFLQKYFVKGIMLGAIKG